MSKFCKKCGAEMRDEAEFCPRCGTAQSVQNVQTGQSINQVGNTYSPNMGGNTYAPNHVSSSGSTNNETIIIAVVAVLVVAIGAFFVVFNGNVDEIKEVLHMGPKQETKVDAAASAPTQTAPAP
ncbi:zinc ribbon domain-containing protein, partial [Anaerovibrio sp.]|uniref:zinc ribbon domain-containing protein n=1 Tax=Anaerovibrio sp. TaxID=1872532 RepID=UPI0025BDB41D